MFNPFTAISRLDALRKMGYALETTIWMVAQAMACLVAASAEQDQLHFPVFLGRSAGYPKSVSSAARSTRRFWRGSGPYFFRIVRTTFVFACRSSYVYLPSLSSLRLIHPITKEAAASTRSVVSQVLRWLPLARISDPLARNRWCCLVRIDRWFVPLMTRCITEVAACCRKKRASKPGHPRPA